MPTYTARCINCAADTEYVRTIAERHDTPGCPRCGGETVLTVTTPPRGFVKNRWEPFKSPVDGSIIRTGRELAEHNRRNNVVSMADGHTTEQLMRMDGKPPGRVKVTRGEVAEAAQLVRNGYKPTVEVDHG